jgi:hypothetical protein
MGAKAFYTRVVNDVSIGDAVRMYDGYYRGVAFQSCVRGNSNCLRWMFRTFLWLLFQLYSSVHGRVLVWCSDMDVDVT